MNGLSVSSIRAAPSRHMQIHQAVHLTKIIISSSFTGALAGRLFSIIHPLGGAIFGVTSSLTDLLAEEAMNYLGCRNSLNIAYKIAKLIIPALLGALGASLATTACGFPITFSASFALTGAILLTNILVGLAITTCCVSSCCVLVFAFRGNPPLV